MTLSTTIEDREFKKFRDIGKNKNAIYSSVTNLQTSAYGDTITAELMPVVAGTPVYGFTPTNFREFLALGGSVSQSGGIMICSSGANVGGYASIQSFRSTTHRPGLGTCIRASAYFATPTANSVSGVGSINIGDEISFGYNGLDFGIWHRYGGRVEVRTLTINTPSSGSTSATLQVNSISFTIPLTAGNAAHNAREVAAYVTANSSAIYAWQNGGTVEFSFASDGPKSGTYSFSHATAAGTFSQVREGILKTSEHIPQSSWNGNKVDWLDATKGNNFQIMFKSGFGNIHFFIESPETDIYELVHTIRAANSQTFKTVTNPNLKCGAYVSTTGTSTGSSVGVAHIASFSTGNTGPTRNPRGFSNTKSISTTATSIFTLRNKRTINGFVNQSEIDILTIELANDGAKSAVFELRSNAVIAGDTNFTSVGTNLISEYDTAGTTVTNGTLLATFTVAKGQSASINLDSLSIRVPPTLAITVSGYMSSGAAADLSAALTWYEEL